MKRSKMQKIIQDILETYFAEHCEIMAEEVLLTCENNGGS